MFRVTVDQRRMKQRMIEEDKNSLIRALKADDSKAAKQALTGMSGEDLGLTHEEFGELTSEVDAASRSKTDLEIARQVLGVGKTEKQSTSTHNPVTGQPWSSSPVKNVSKHQGMQQKNDISLTPSELDTLHQYRASAMGLKSFNYGDLSQIVSDIQTGYAVIAGTAGAALIDKIIKFVKQAYPSKYKDADFPDL